jgi:hypothetical protein
MRAALRGQTKVTLQQKNDHERHSMQSLFYLIMHRGTMCTTTNSSSSSSGDGGGSNDTQEFI